MATTRGLGFEAPYLLFLGDVEDAHYAKTALGLAYWVPDRCLGQLRLPGCRVDAGLPDLTPAEAAARGARSMVIGVANTGGYIAASWHEALVAALDAGLDLVSGLHTRLDSLPEVAEAAGRNGNALYEVRHTDRRFGTATGEPRSGRRLLTVGTDCAVGKKYTALVIAQALQARGVPVDFRATGQTGILIAGRGVAVDAVKADFVAGAAEWLAPANAPEHWDVIEGQGSLFHPSYAGVTLGLLHGAQPEVLVLCHEAGRSHIDGFPRYPIPPLEACLDFYLRAGRLTSPQIRCAGISLNTSKLDEAEARRRLEETEQALGLPCFDPVRTGAARLVDHLLAHTA